LAVSQCYRTALRHLSNTCFIGVTGSCGKTTATQLIAAILAEEGRVRKGDHENEVGYIAKTIRAVSPRDRFCVCEVSGHAKGVMEQAARLLQPEIGVVTHIGQDHYSSFRSLEATAAEKGKLIEALPGDGVAVLNADDPHVYAMRTRTRARIITYGLSEGATVRAANVTSAWPERLSLDVCHAGGRHHVQTQLLGTHWTHTVLAALSAALGTGVPLQRAVKAVEAFAPIPYRMSPHETPGGVTFVSDTRKAPFWTIGASLEFLRAARAERKILVIGAVSDTSKGFRQRYATIARQALEAADKALFVGDYAHAALKARTHPEDDRVMAFGMLCQLDSYLRSHLKSGDLVLLKGNQNSDHLHRIVLAQTNEIACWREKCGRTHPCGDCDLQYSRFVPIEEQASPY
jgi:UDP-N-acetylmuramyl pentapeptide synthase